MNLSLTRTHSSTSSVALVHIPTRTLSETVREKGASEEVVVAVGPHILTCGLAVDHQDVGHLSKLDTGGVLLNFFQEFSKDDFTPANERMRRDIAYTSQGPLLLWVSHPERTTL